MRATLYLDPPSHHFLRNQLFNVHDKRWIGDHVLAPYAHLRSVLSSQGIPVHTADYLPAAPGDGLKIYVSLGMRRNFRKLAARKDVVLSAFFALESPIVEPTLYRALGKLQNYFRHVFSWSTGESLRPFVGRLLRCERFHVPQSFEDVHESIWSRTDRKFLVMINSNRLPRIYKGELYTERLKAIEFFARTREIDLYGFGWDGPPYQPGPRFVPNVLLRTHRALLSYWSRFRPHPLWAAARQVYRGPVTSKAQTLGQYNFAICFENMILQGYVTEKIFDCFFAGTIPIYLGAPDIETLVPRECFIDARRFPTYSDLRTYLKSLSERGILAYRASAREYLHSAQFRPFTKHAFAELFQQIVRESLDSRSAD